MCGRRGWEGRRGSVEPTQDTQERIRSHVLSVRPAGAEDKIAKFKNFKQICCVCVSQDILTM